MKLRLNQNYFIAAFAALTVVLAYYASQLSVQNLEIVANKFISGSLTLAVPSLFIHYLRGTKYDVYEEIFDHKNIAAAILLGFAWLAVAVAFTVVS